ncbi:MAG: hypothetical protein HRT35_11935 [Algicola sp.]|nr:hypothetical protein [Algicola sp.]
MGYKAYLLIIVMLAFSPFASAKNWACEKPGLDLDKLYNAFGQIRKEDDDNFAQTPEGEPLKDIQANRYRSLFSQCIKGRVTSTLIKSLDAKQHVRLFTALNKVAFYTMDQQVVRLMEMLTSAEFGISKVSDKQWQLLHRAYMMSRQFEKLNDLVKSHPLLFPEPLPVINAKAIDQRSLYQVDKNKQSLSQKPFEFPSGGHLVVVSSPICKPCKQAIGWLKSKPAVFDVVVKNSTWITPVFGDMFFDEIKQSHKDYAPIEMKYTYQEGQWPEIEFWGTPSFYFYMDGKLVKQVVGWPGNDRAKALLAGLKAIALL